MTPRDQATAIFLAGVAAADPADCVRRALSGRRLPERVCVVGAGKAAVPMAQAAEEFLPDATGLVITKYGHAGPTRRIVVREAGHPIPDEAGVRATRELLSRMQGDRIVILLSGGASALLVSPADPLTLADKQAATGLLLRAGVPIAKVNCVRKRLSAVKGGRLAAAARAPVLTLILSDVIGDPLDAIGSGPTAPDPTTREDALRIVRESGIEDRLPVAVRRHLAVGPETPKPGDPLFDRVENVVVGNNRMAIEGAEREAKRLGLKPILVPEPLQGEAREAGRLLAKRAMELEPGECLIAGGETTVTVQGSGRGGRNQELALAAAIELAGTEGVVLLSGGTDGTDGPTDAAGAVVDGATATPDAAAWLDANDSYGFFSRFGGLLVTGPTRTNVMDLVVALRAAKER